MCGQTLGRQIVDKRLRENKPRTSPADGRRPRRVDEAVAEGLALVAGIRNGDWRSWAFWSCDGRKCSTAAGASRQLPGREGRDRIRREGFVPFSHTPGRCTQPSIPLLPEALPMHWPSSGQLGG